jgi:hypothetical protein
MGIYGSKDGLWNMPDRIFQKTERFFRLLKQSAVDAYVLSTVGMVSYLGYRWNTAILEFRGCTHPEHQNPKA